MARTPLLRALDRLFADSHRARARRVPLAGLAELRSTPSNAARVSRRSALVGAGAAALSIALPEAALAKGSASITIVGGGIAGLSCALKLRDHGVAATVYEASGRSGGRIFSNTGYWDQGQISEWCGELIDSGHETMQALARRFRLPLDELHAAEPNGSQDTYKFFGSYYSKHDADADFLADVAAKVAADAEAAGYPTTFDSFTVEGGELDAMSVYEWIESRVPGGHRSELGQLLDLAYNIEYGAETREQSALNLVYLLGFQPSETGLDVYGESDERYHIRGGNQQLPNAIAEHLGDVRYGHALARIARTPAGRYRLTFERAGRALEIVTDYVVLALPFAVLREIDYSAAGFDTLKHQAIQELGRGRSGKTQLQFERRLWNHRGAWPGISNGSSYADTGYQSSWEVTRAQPGKQGILVFYSGGRTAANMVAQRAFTTASDAAALSDATTALRRAEPVFPGLGAAWNGRATQSLPHKAREFKCSYSYWRVGQYLEFAGYEGATQEGVLFAGEHTSTDFQGFMEGGASEGQRAAREILAAVRGRVSMAG
jgi:monoamine oxidase